MSKHLTWLAGALAALQPAPVAAAPIDELAGWKVSESVAPLDGARSLMASAVSASPLVGITGAPRPAVLAIRCQDGRASAALSWPGYLGRDQVTVEWRVGASEIRRELWFMQRGRSEIALTEGTKQARRFFEAIERGGELVMRVHAYRGAQDATFSLAGAVPAVAAMRLACPKA